MKLAHFENPLNWGESRLGLLVGDVIVDLASACELLNVPFPHRKITDFPTWLPGLWRSPDLVEWSRAVCQKVVEQDAASLKFHDGTPLVFPVSETHFYAGARGLKSLRDFYAFEQHVRTANENRGRDVPKEWYEFPVFYFSNFTEIFGHQDTIPYPAATQALDYELEVACVIGKQGRDIPADEAENYIFGYMIYNDWSARDIQRKEIAVGLGPAKSKDFAQSFGPYLVTPDDLADCHTGRPGVYDLEMVARVNGVERSRGNWKNIHWSFGQMIERASQGVMLYPGDVIGSGTVGTGCLLELTKGQGPWLQPGDVVELEIERLGVLRNVVGERR